MSAPLLTLHLDGEPVAKGRPRFGKGGKVYTPEATAAAENKLGWEVKRAYPGIEPTGALVSLTVVFRSAGSAAKRNGRADLDNLVKLVKDALNGIAWLDDSQVVHIDATLFRASPTPGTWLTVAPFAGSNEGESRDV